MTQLAISYFGKLPARSDFVKSAGDRRLLELLDQWLADVMNQLTPNPRWRQHYDAMRPVHFAFIGTRNKVAIAGHLAASRDQSERRFPFMTMSAMKLEDPLAFLPGSPLVLAPFWRELAEHTADAQSAHDPAAALQRLAGSAIDVDATGQDCIQKLHNFLTQATLADLDAMLEMKDGARRLVLTLGLLLWPMHAHSGARLSKSLVLPLPAALHERMLICAFWLQLGSVFLRGVDMELALFLCEREGRHTLVAGFNGANAATLQAIIDPEFAAEQQIAVADNNWLESELAAMPEAEHLAACLAQPQLPLAAALRLFRQTFS